MNGARGFAVHTNILPPSLSQFQQALSAASLTVMNLHSDIFPAAWLPGRGLGGAQPRDFFKEEYCAQATFYTTPERALGRPAAVGG